MTRTLLLVLAVLAAAPVSAQTFTRITDPTNPILQDRFQSGGGAWADLDGDGLPELFVANGNLSNENNSLFKNLGGGQFARIVSGSVVHDGGSSIGGTWGDFDNDGRLDLFVTNRGNFGNFLYRGIGDTSFVRITVGAAVTDIGNSNGSSWVDLDRDGDLDLYVVNFQGDDFVYVNGGPPSYVLTRVPNVPFTTGTTFSIPGAWADYDRDLDPDLFLGNAGTQNDDLLTNLGSLSFAHTTIADGQSTLGASWGDYDNDGDLDLFVAHYSNQADALYRNGGAPGFTLSPIAAPPITTELASSVGSAWGDCDNDGDLDLFVVHDGQTSSLFLNSGPPDYSFSAASGVEVSEALASFGCSWADWDGDGDLDLFVATHLSQGNRLYRNEGNGNHWLRMRCVGTNSNAAGIGATVHVHATIGGAPRWQMREVPAQTGYNSQTLELHVGLGDATLADTILVDWPSGHRDTLVSIAADQRIDLVEGTTVTAVPSGIGAPIALAARPLGDGRFEISYTLATDGPFALEVFDAMGRRRQTIVRGQGTAGHHFARIEAGTLGDAGFYWCRLVSGTERRVARLLVLR